MNPYTGLLKWLLKPTLEKALHNTQRPSSSREQNKKEDREEKGDRDQNEKEIVMKKRAKGRKYTPKANDRKIWR